MFWSLTSLTEGVNSKETLLSSQKKSYSRIVLWIPLCCSNKEGQNNNDPARLSQCIKKLLQWLFLEIGNSKCIVHAKKQKILQKSGLHEALIKMLLKWSYCICRYGHLLPIRQRIKGRGRSRYHAAWDSFSNFFLFWFISPFGIPLWYFILWFLENFLRITTFLKPGLNLFEK